MPDETPDETPDMVVEILRPAPDTTYSVSVQANTSEFNREAEAYRLNKPTNLVPLDEGEIEEMVGILGALPRLCKFSFYRAEPCVPYVEKPRVFEILEVGETEDGDIELKTLEIEGAVVIKGDGGAVYLAGPDGKPLEFTRTLVLGIAPDPDEEDDDQFVLDPRDDDQFDATEGEGEFDPTEHDFDEEEEDFDDEAFDAEHFRDHWER